MELINLVHQTEIIVLHTVNLQTFCEINVSFIKFRKYSSQNYKTGQVIAWTKKKFLKISSLNF